MAAQNREAAPKLQIVIADLTWCTCFVGSYLLLAVLWNTWWALPLVLTCALMMAGLTEVAHHGLHGNLYARSRFWNHAFGSLASAILGIGFGTYRDHHFVHHRTVATPHDPERTFYQFPEYAERAARWHELSSWQKFAALPGIIGSFATTLLGTLHSSSPLVHVFRWGVPLALAISAYFDGLRYLIPLKLVIAWYLPVGLFVCIDFILMQSEHYGSQIRPVQRISTAEQYEVSWNVRLPAIVQFMVMGRNMHAEHHACPSLHWSLARDHGSRRTLALGEYLRGWWAHGPRMAASPPSERAFDDAATVISPST